MALAGLAVGALGQRSDPRRRRARRPTCRRSSSTCSRSSPDRVPAFHEFLAILGPLLGIAFGFDADQRRALATHPAAPGRSADPSRRGDQRQVRRRTRRDRVGPRRGDGRRRVVRDAAPRHRTDHRTTSCACSPSSSSPSCTSPCGWRWRSCCRWSLVGPPRPHWRASPSGCVFTLFGGLIAGLVADTVHPVPSTSPTTEQVLANARLELTVRRFSPSSSTRKRPACC